MDDAGGGAFDAVSALDVASRLVPALSLGADLSAGFASFRLVVPFDTSSSTDEGCAAAFAPVVFFEAAGFAPLFGDFSTGFATGCFDFTVDGFALALASFFDPGPARAVSFLSLTAASFAVFSTFDACPFAGLRVLANVRTFRISP
ncbi:hypothetical protein [Aliiroseovarius lamellibrachiae]|uniref:hypothetical protein n=1 Tax=Aliiroseovarius lamellibrachiae TaxID=1924933 RepID=UPI001BE05F45|nr:hypothetical protein [Aliiroseovarius lamellibrachiae]MBT2131887.1 hypothetical protein [Aliiroseovarius lamellibrachiae]